MQMLQHGGLRPAIGGHENRQGFSNFPLTHGFTTTAMGNMSLKWGLKPDVDGALEKVHRLYRVRPEERVHMVPEHGNNVAFAGGKRGQSVVCDGLISVEPGYALTMCPADCLPIVLTAQSSKRRFAGLVHGSQKALAAGILKSTIQEIVALLSCPADLILVAIGPGIRPCCYDKDDLIEIALGQLRILGVKEEHIWADPKVCTCCSRFPGTKNPVYFSHRRAEKTGETEGRFLAFCMMTPEQGHGGRNEKERTDLRAVDTSTTLAEGI